MFTLRLKDLRFETGVVMSPVERAERRNLMKQGAFVRTAAKSSIKPRKKPSRPGNPPRSHTGLLKRHIYFVHDPVRRTVVIGPTLLNSAKRRNVRPATTVPNVLEYGGKARVIDRRTLRTRTIRIAERPYMRPALKKGLDDLERIWKDSVT